MKKHIVLSVNDNHEYLFYLPLTVWAWRKFGWEPVILFHGEFTEAQQLIGQMEPCNDWIWVRSIEGYESNTITQVSRLYGSKHDIGYFMTGDIDMIPLSDYWKPSDEKEITVWGHDLTGYNHMPICYIGMHSYMWASVMCFADGDINDYIKRDLDLIPNAKSTDSTKRWVVDQDLITERINAVQFKKNFVSRGTLPNGYPIGRVDRSAWSINHDTLIDCHLPRGIYRDKEAFEKTMQLLHVAFPNDNFDWFVEYTEKFKQLVK
jgi:hypothetical protein